MHEDFDLSTPFDELGLDSLDKVAFLTSVESEFQTLFEDNVFDNFRSSQDVINFLSQSYDVI